MDKTPIRGALPELPKDAFDLLRSINHAHQFAGLYGKEHPNALSSMQNLVDIAIRQFEQSSKITYMFTKEANFVNDIPYSNSTDSIHLLHKLRMRGVLSITFNPPMTRVQVEGFIAFLLEYPQKLRDTGGPERFLQERGVTSITLTEAFMFLKMKMSRMASTLIMRLHHPIWRTWIPLSNGSPAVRKILIHRIYR